jgi:hypothetical protein
MISESLKHKNAEIYFENIISFRTENENIGTLPGKKIYTVVGNDEETNIVTLRDDEGKEYAFEHDVLAKAMLEDSTLSGFQVLQYPLGYVLASSSTELSNLSIYDPRLKDPYKKNKKDK